MTVTNNVKKPHKHAALIKQWADGVKIQARNEDFGSVDVGPEWHDAVTPLWHAGNQYRLKPEPEYPKSTIDYTTLCKYVNMAYFTPSFESSETILARAVADAAVKEFITSGEMVKYFMNPVNGYVNKEST